MFPSIESFSLMWWKIECLLFTTARDKTVHQQLWLMIYGTCYRPYY